MSGPKLQTPISVSLAPVSEMPPMVIKAVDTVKPFGGLLGAAIVGAVAAYFVPRALDRMFSGHGENVELEVEE
jgi:hypothetical protein